MAESSIADEITRLSACRNDILSAISAKGVTVPVGSVLSSCPSLIASIPTGGGGGGTALVNTGISAMYSAVLTASVTATQIPAGGWLPLPFTANGNEVWASGEWGDISGMTAISVTGRPQIYGIFTNQVGLMTAYQSYWPTGSIGVDWSSDGSTLASGTVNGSWNTSMLGTLYPDTTVYLTIRSVVNSDTQGVAIDNGGGALPYPDRPATSYVTATASATSYKWATTGNGYLNVKYVDGLGYESSYTTYSVQSAELGNIIAMSNSLQATLTGYYPETAYGIYVGPIGISNAYGSGWK